MVPLSCMPCRLRLVTRCPPPSSAPHHTPARKMTFLLPAAVLLSASETPRRGAIRARNHPASPAQSTGLVPTLGIYPLASPDWSLLQAAARAA
eukprot:9423999-Pyramimonas_sp.AAC.1